MRTSLRGGLAAASIAFPLVPSVQAQGFSTPGMPVRTAEPQAAAPTADGSQTSGFSTVFNPAFAFVVDALADHQSGDLDEEGWALALRSAELSAKSWIDPKAWAYLVAVGEEDGVSFEEAAIHYKGLGDTHTIRAGRFFADFGKQMQAHVHDLRTIDRPLPLRAYLGSELGGDGVQWDSWTPMGDDGALRWSVGAFASLVAHEHGAEEGALEVERHVAERKDFGDLNFTARATAFKDVGEDATLQAGVSLLAIPDYTAEAGSLAEVEGLDQTIVGFDLTLGFGADGGPKWTVGGEYLHASGDTVLGIDDGALLGDPADDTISVASEGLGGWYAYVDWAYDAHNSVGLQYAQADVAGEGATADASELDLYWTRWFSEYHRFRIAVTQASQDDDDVLRFALQYTGFVGAHAHGVNW